MLSSAISIFAQPGRYSSNNTQRKGGLGLLLGTAVASTTTNRSSFAPSRTERLWCLWSNRSAAAIMALNIQQDTGHKPRLMTTVYIYSLWNKSPMLKALQKSLLFLSAANIWEKALRPPVLVRGLQEQLQKAAKESSSNASVSNFSLAKMLSVCRSPQGTSEEQKPQKDLSSIALSYAQPCTVVTPWPQWCWEWAGDEGNIFPQHWLI